MRIGEQIRALRKKNKISADRLGKLVGLSQQQISSFEIGRCNITIDKLEKICEVFNISPSYFFPPSEMSPELKQALAIAKNITPDIAVIVELAQKLTPQQLEAIKTVARNFIK